ncbi:hypothetical protein FAVG1_01386 [Fusarium avenaceum]|nr:hypothetical protein FAVG1_01386 [Fusarium avenaceum]
MSSMPNTSTKLIQTTIQPSLPGLSFSLGVMHIGLSRVINTVDWSIYKRECRWIAAVLKAMELMERLLLRAIYDAAANHGNKEQNTQNTTTAATTADSYVQSTKTASTVQESSRTYTDTTGCTTRHMRRKTTSPAREDSVQLVGRVSVGKIVSLGIFHGPCAMKETVKDVEECGFFDFTVDFIA